MEESRPASIGKGDILSGAVIAALGVFVVTEASNWAFLGPSGPGPGFFPMCYGVGMIVLSLVLCGHRLATRRPATGEPLDWGGVAVALSAWAGFVAAIPIMIYFGFLVAFALLILFAVVVVFGRPIRHGLIAAVLCPAAFQLVFPTLLQVRLPVGTITGF